MRDRSEEIVAAYRTYFPVLLRRCQRVLGDTADAQEIAQETFVRLWSARQDLRDTDRVIGWLYTTSNRLAVDRVRRQRPEPAGTFELSGAEEQAPEHIVAARQLLRRLADLLDAPQLELLILSRIDGMQQREIAELLGTSERTVRRRLTELEERLGLLGGDRG